MSSAPYNCCYSSDLTIARTTGFAGVDSTDLQLTSSFGNESAYSFELYREKVLKPQALVTSFSIEIL